MSSTPAPLEEQGRLLEEALGVVRQQSHMMRKFLETPGKLMDALKCAYVPADQAPSWTGFPHEGMRKAAH